MNSGYSTRNTLYIVQSKLKSFDQKVLFIILCGGSEMEFYIVDVFLAEKK